MKLLSYYRLKSSIDCGEMRTKFTKKQVMNYEDFQINISDLEETI